jgi:LPS O-antigen subunit length determinant protein (WzzB/FepE family)
MELYIGIFFIVLALVYKLFLEEKYTASEYLSEQAYKYFNKRNNKKENT